MSFQITGGQQPSTVNLRPGATASQPGIPQVRVTVDRQRVRLGTEVTFSLAPANIVNDYIVTLYFGDLDERGNRRSEVMRAPQTTHTYQAVGTYTYAVDVKHRQAPPCNPSVTLTATPNSVAESQPVSFSAQLSERCPNLRYRFFYGDGSSSGWQSSPQSQHDYSRAGRYLAYVDINDGNNRIGGSPRRSVNVTQRVGPLTVSLSAQPMAARSGRPITFIATPSEQRAGARYQFNFGDGTRSEWQAAPQAIHTYRRGGRYRAYVQISQNNLNAIATSPRLMVASGPDSIVDPVQRPTPTTSPRTSPSPAVNPTPAPDGSPTPPNGSPSPGGSPASPNGSSSPGGSPVAPNGTSSPGASPAGGTINDSSGSDPLNLVRDASRRRWWYLLIAALILLAIYQASGYLFAAQPTFTPFPDAGVAAVAAEKGAAPFGLELLLEPNVSTGDYALSTDAPRLVANDPPAEERQVIEI